MNRLKRAKTNVFWGIASKVVSILGPFFIRTLIIKILGTEYAGVNGAFTSLLQVLNFAELGFANAIVYSMYKPVAENNRELVCALLKYIRHIYKLISIGLFIVGIGIIPFVKFFIKGSIPPDINIYWLYLIYLFNLLSGYLLYAHENSVLVAYQRNDIESMILFFVNIIMYVLQVISILFLKNYYIYIILLPVSTILINFIRHFCVKQLFPEIKSRGKVPDELKNDIKKRVWALVGHKIGLPITNSIDSLVISSFLGVVSLALYENYSYIFQAIGAVLTICYATITPIIGNAIITEDCEHNYETFMMLSFGNLWVVSWCAIALVVLYQNFVTIWVGDEFRLGYEVVIALALSFYIAYMRFIGTTYKDACGMWKEDKYKPYVICIANLILDILAVNVFDMGVLGVVITTLILRLFVAVPWETYVLFKYYFKKSVRSYLCLLGKWLVVFLITSVLMVVLLDVVFKFDYSIVSLFVRTASLVLVPNILFLLCFRRNDLLKRIISYLKENIVKKGDK